MRSRLLVLALVLPLLLAARQNQPELEFKEFSPEEGGFTILLPGVPKEQTRKEKGPGGKEESTLHLFTVDLKTSTSAYQVAYTVDPNLAKADADALKGMLERVRRGAEDSLRGKLLSEKKITLEEKYPGVEIQVEIPEGRVYRSRVYVVEDRLYQMTVLGPKDVTQSKEADQFLDSFKLSK
jgi:hypothetical protein